MDTCKIFVATKQCLCTRKNPLLCSLRFLIWGMLAFMHNATKLHLNLLHAEGAWQGRICTLLEYRRQRGKYNLHVAKSTTALLIEEIPN
jgi:hypothetical protein